MTQPVTKPASQLVVGDRILPKYLPAFSLDTPAEVILMRIHDYHRAQWVFIAYAHEDGFHDSASFLPEKEVEVYPAVPPGFDYSRADDQPGPVAGRIPPHFEDGRPVVEVAGGLIEIDPPEGFVPASAPSDMTGAAVTPNCVFVGDLGGWCNTHEAVHIASGEGECGCPVYPYLGRGDVADTIIDHRRNCLASAD